MTFRLNISKEAKQQLVTLKFNPHLEKRLKAVSNALKKLQENPRHPGLNVHLIDNILGPNGEKIWKLMPKIIPPELPDFLLLWSGKTNDKHSIYFTPSGLNKS